MTTTDAPPQVSSLALRGIPTPDYAETQYIPLPPGAPTDPAEWARAIFDVGQTPGWVKALLMFRQAVVGWVGIDRAAPDIFAVVSVQGEEALITADDAHLDFRVAVGVDAAAGLVRLTTSVKIHNRRGRLYFLPVRLLHSPVSFAMMHRAARRLSRAG